MFQIKHSKKIQRQIKYLHFDNCVPMHSGFTVFLIRDTEKSNDNVELCGTRQMHVPVLGTGKLNYFHYKMTTLAYKMFLGHSINSY